MATVYSGTQVLQAGCRFSREYTRRDTRVTEVHSSWQTPLFWTRERECLWCWFRLSSNKLDSGRLCRRVDLADKGFPDSGKQPSLLHTLVSLFQYSHGLFLSLSVDCMEKYISIQSRCMNWRDPSARASYRISNNRLCVADNILGTSHPLSASRALSYKVQQHQSNRALRWLNPQIATLMNQTNLVNTVKPHLGLNTFHRQNGRKYTIGATNSISGQRAHGISEVFGSALWLVEYCLDITSQVSDLVECTGLISWLILFRVLPECICITVHLIDT